MPEYGVSPLLGPKYGISARGIAKLEGLVGIGIDEKVCRNIGVLSTITDSFLDTSTDMDHP